MRVDSFVVNGLHGIIETDLTFRPDMNVIVGRNGSGKTSVLDLLSHIIRLDLPSIAKIQFSNATLTLSDYNNEKFTVRLETIGAELTIAIQYADSKPASLSFSSAYLHERGYYEYVIQKKREKNDEWSRRAKQLRDNARLAFVRLDRTIIAIDPDGTESIENSASHRGGGKSNSGVRDPIEEVIRVTRAKYIQFRVIADDIQKRASSDLIKLHFSQHLSVNVKKKDGAESRLSETLRNLRIKVTNSRLIGGDQGYVSLIDNYFDRLEKMLTEAFHTEEARRTGRRTLKEENLELMIGQQERQINHLLKIFDDEQRDTEKAYTEIKRFIDVADRFLNHSGKELLFSPENLELAFRLTNQHVQSIEPRSIRQLSSGERQVLIVLTHLAFLAGENSIFVIDEPELSLHVTWQNQLVDALKELSPRHCQIILATHSPEVAGAARECAQILKPKYLPVGEF